MMKAYSKAAAMGMEEVGTGKWKVGSMAQVLQRQRFLTWCRGCSQCQETFLVVITGVGGGVCVCAFGLSLVDVRGAAKHPIMHRTRPPQ